MLTLDVVFTEYFCDFNPFKVPTQVLIIRLGLRIVEGANFEER
jgi:hypothetical protein